jgi:hypothetical protein
VLEMKKLLLTACFALALGALGPVSAAAGPSWPFHRHHKDAAAKTSKPAKSKSENGRKSLFHRQKSQDKAREQSARAEAGVSPGPKSVGWRHQTPGPAGAGAY